MNRIINFSLTLIAILSMTFIVHVYVLHHFSLPEFDNRIIAAYLVNFFLAIFIYGLLLVLRDKMESQLGFLYMAGSLIKFIFFFIFFYPSYKNDGEITSLEFAAFFLPYVICLIFETFCIIKFLKK